MDAKNNKMKVTWAFRNAMVGLMLSLILAVPSIGVQAATSTSVNQTTNNGYL